ncbi:hypothetical protein ACRRVB_00135 [Candidatus Cardinium hertigii]
MQRYDSLLFARIAAHAIPSTTLHVKNKVTFSMGGWRIFMINGKLF